MSPFRVPPFRLPVYKMRHKRRGRLVIGTIEKNITVVVDPSDREVVSSNEKKVVVHAPLYGKPKE